MSKPILVIRFPYSEAFIEGMPNIAERLERKIDDYHILPIMDDHTGGQIKFECFNSPHTEIEFEELKQRVLEAIKH